MIDATASVRACPICLGDLDMEPTRRGAFYTCRYCGGLEIRFPPRPASVLVPDDHRHYAA